MDYPHEIATLLSLLPLQYLHSTRLEVNLSIYGICLTEYGALYHNKANTFFNEYKNKMWTNSNTVT